MNKDEKKVFYKMIDVLVNSEDNDEKLNALDTIESILRPDKEVASDLTFFSTRELMDEVRARHTAVLCMTVQDHKLQSENADVIDRYNKGSFHTLVGLAEIYSAWAKSQFVNSGDDEKISS